VQFSLIHRFCSVLNSTDNRRKSVVGVAFQVVRIGRGLPLSRSSSAPGQTRHTSGWQPSHWHRSGMSGGMRRHRRKTICQIRVVDLRSPAQLVESVGGPLRCLLLHLAATKRPCAISNRSGSDRASPRARPWPSTSQNLIRANAARFLLAPPSC
jgi:hypothetical protein